MSVEGFGHEGPEGSSHSSNYCLYDMTVKQSYSINNSINQFIHMTIFEELTVPQYLKNDEWSIWFVLIKKLCRSFEDESNFGH